jgi:hypothetical protein
MFLGDNVMYAIPEASDPTAIAMDSLSTQPRVLDGTLGYNSELTKASGALHMPVPPTRTSVLVLSSYKTPTSVPPALPGYEMLTTEPAGEYAAYSQGSVGYYSIPDTENHYAVPMAAGEPAYSLSAVRMATTHGTSGVTDLLACLLT